LELIWESSGEAHDPLDKELLPDELGLNIINNLSESIEYQRVNDKNRVTLLMRKS
jgi:polar amino acid transport system ATP-binding protein